MVSVEGKASCHDLFFHFYIAENIRLLALGQWFAKGIKGRRTAASLL
jgi:hypothetical protein